jgi:hypothetical protein
MIPPVAWSVRAQGRARRRLHLRSRPGLGEDAITSEVGAEVEPWGRARRRPSSEVEVEAEPWGRARRRPSSEAEAGAEPLGRARRRPPVAPEAGLSYCQPHPDGCTAVGAGQAALFSCQVSQWRGEVTAVTSALSTEDRASG